MTTTRHRDVWVMVGMAVAAASAATASFTGLRGLALAAGWPDRLAWLLPLTIDAYAMTSTRVWLAAGPSRQGRGYAQANAIGAIGVSIVGNAIYHMLSTGLLTVAWPIVVSVGAVPAAVLGLTAHLHALRAVPAEAKDGPESGPESKPLPQQRARTPKRAKRRTEDQLLVAAREADAQYRAGNDGRPIPRDALRKALRIAGPRATELRRQLAAETPDRKEAQPTA